jgi:Major intrinsic protein
VAVRKRWFSAPRIAALVSQSLCKQSQMQEPSLAAKLGAEFLGTFLLVFGVCGSVVIAGEFLSKNDVQLGIGLLGISLTAGFAVLVGAFAFGHVWEATSTPRSASAWQSRSDSSGRVYCPTSAPKSSRLLLLALCCLPSHPASQGSAPGEWLRHERLW